MNEYLSESDIRAVYQIVSTQLHASQDHLTNGASLEQDLGADSLDLVELNMALEDHFNIQIPDETAERIQTIGDIFETLGDLLQLTPKQTFSSLSE